ncbi:hypothetical protein OG896_06145 [Streptomyces sp. NBC_00669]|uniref:hypothetical protein n=1 Tax=Streptomyces sp. NBC_00669 TaxID=2976011 RepID=UPI002E37E550|nr:hypothetical protein [Streptomyces sp. NBC_00669]
MIRSLARRPRLLVLGVCAVVAVTTVGWYATQSVRPRCGVVIFSGPYTSVGGPDSSSDNGKVRTDQRLADRAYRQAAAAAGCRPPHARWHGWFA